MTSLTDDEYEDLGRDWFDACRPFQAVSDQLDALIKEVACKVGPGPLGFRSQTERNLWNDLHGSLLDARNDADITAAIMLGEEAYHDGNAEEVRRQIDRLYCAPRRPMPVTVDLADDLRRSVSIADAVDNALDASNRTYAAAMGMKEPG